MRCILCDNDKITEGTTQCPCCGFPVYTLAGFGDDADFQEAVNKKAREFGNGIKKNVKIGLKVYSYKREGDDLVQDQVETKIIAERLDTVPEKTVRWDEEKFARIESEKQIPLNITVDYNGKRMEYNLPISVPDFHDFWQAGVKTEEHLKFRVVIGKADDYEETELIPIIPVKK